MTADEVLNRMFDTLEAGGWECVAVFDGEETERVKSRAEALDVINSVEYSVAKFRNKDGIVHNVVLIPGNGEDVISDHSVGVACNFNELMDSIIQ